jgi:hypothetical protein
MRPEVKAKFFKLVGEVMAGYGKALDPATLEVWFNMLAPFDPATIRRAFESYSAERPDLAPTPNGIAARCRITDGRPGMEEAWAISLTSQDEADTVVWTAEMAEAFALCRPVLAMGDEVGARMAFKDAYTRLVAQARASHKPVTWSASMGWDQTKRIAVLKRAAVAGLLPAPQATALLAGPAGDPTPDNNARSQLAAIRKMLADSAAEKERAIEAQAEADRQTEADSKARTQAQVDAYLDGNVAAA